MLKYILAPIGVWFISQTLKVLYRVLIRKETRSLKHLIWIYDYGSGAPSTHSALLVSGVWIVGANYGIGPLFYFALVVAGALIYNLDRDWKKEMIIEAHLRKSNDSVLRDMVTEGEVLDMSGHPWGEIIIGVVLGALLGMVIEWLP